jgi:peptidoglycan/LPS O-acetylase OafA/YrhL
MHSLDGLRGLAAVAVVVLHAWMYTERHRPDRSELAARVIGEFRLAVVCFFVLSGFLLALPWVAARAGEREPPRLGRFALRRLARIGPAYWVAVAGSVAVLHESGHSRAVPFSDLPKFALFVQNVFHSTRNQLDPPMWSMHVEATFYVALPLIGLALVRTGRGRARALAICAALVVANLVWRGVAVAWQLPPEARWTLPTYLGAFACGIAAAVLIADARRHPRTAALAGVAGVALVVANGAWYAAGPTTAGRIVADLPAAAGFAAIVCALALRPGGILGSAPLRALGALSYGIYLWHMPVLYGLQIHERLPERFGPALLAIAPLTVAAAALSWFLVERPAIRFAARVPAARRASRASPRSRPQPAES